MIMYKMMGMMVTENYKNVALPSALRERCETRPHHVWDATAHAVLVNWVANGVKRGSENFSIICNRNWPVHSYTSIFLQSTFTYEAWSCFLLKNVLAKN